MHDTAKSLWFLTREKVAFHNLEIQTAASACTAFELLRANSELMLLVVT